MGIAESFSASCGPDVGYLSHERYTIKRGGKEEGWLEVLHVKLSSNRQHAIAARLGAYPTEDAAASVMGTAAKDWATRWDENYGHR